MKIKPEDKEILDNLRESIREQTLRGEFWGKGGALIKEKTSLMHSRNLEGTFLISSFSSASSTYYAASGNAVSRAKGSNLFSKLFWYWRSWKCLRKSGRFSDKFAALKKMEDMSLGELDGRACILHKRKCRQESLGYLSHGIMKISTKQMGTNHDLCLFLIHEAEILAETGKKKNAHRNYEQTMELSKNDAVSVLTKVRVLKSYGEFLAEEGIREKAEDVLGEALDMAKENELYDQKRKITAIFNDYKLSIR